MLGHVLVVHKASAMADQIASEMKKSLMRRDGRGRCDSNQSGMKSIGTTPHARAVELFPSA